MIKCIRGVLFDMDGLMFDTESLWQNFFLLAAGDLGLPADETTSEETRGMCISELADYYGKRFGVLAEEKIPKLFELVVQHKEEYFEHNNVVAKKGLTELLDYLYDKHIPCAVVTSSNRKDVEQFLLQAQVPNHFSKIVDSSMFQNGKPDPEMYLVGSEAIGLRPEECIVLEDTLSGLRAAKAAGCAPVMIPDLVWPGKEAMQLVQAVLPDLACVIGLLEGWKAQD